MNDILQQLNPNWKVVKLLIKDQTYCYADLKDYEELLSSGSDFIKANSVVGPRKEINEIKVNVNDVSTIYYTPKGSGLYSGSVDLLY